MSDMSLSEVLKETASEDENLTRFQAEIMYSAITEIERLHTAIYCASRTTPGHAKNILISALSGSGDHKKDGE